MELLNNKPTTSLGDMEDNEYKEYIGVLNSVLFKTKEQNQHITMTAKMYPYCKKGDMDIIRVHGLQAASHAFANADLYGKFVGIAAYLTTLDDSKNLPYPFEDDMSSIIYIISTIPKSMDEKIFLQRIDFVIDCIDSIKSKQDLAMACIQRDIPFLSSMGTARRLDPSKLEIMELEKTSYDPIAKRMRNWKRKNKIRNKIWVVCSTEPPRPVEAGKPLPSMIFVPASAGLLLASECVKKLINK